MKTTFMGYPRPDGGVGIRNFVAVISTVSCANLVAERIAREVEGAVAICHGHGCGRRPEREMHNRILAGLGRNPNVYGVVLVSLLLVTYIPFLSMAIPNALGLVSLPAGFNMFFVG